jgi:hypothetical protein
MERRWWSALAGCGIAVWTAGATAQTTCNDPARTVFASGAAACRAFDADPPSCQRAWALTQNGNQAVSCFYTAQTCQGCGPTNQNAGVCTNSCAAPPPTSVPLAPLQVVAGLSAILLALGAGATAARDGKSGEGRAR